MQTTDSTQEIKYIYRRFEETLKLGGKEFDPHVVWPLVLFVVLAVALVYIILMYLRDSRTVGWWAVPLGLLRCCVYGLLAWVFLLPAKEMWEKIDQHSKVLVAPDVSRSMHVKDDPPTDTLSVAQLPTRLDKVSDFFADGKFLAGLHTQNPVSIYRFGGGPDDTPWVLRQGETMTADAFKEWLYVRDALPADDEAKKKMQEVHQRLLGSTNYGESLLRITNREFNNLVQALIVFGDGRNTQGSDQAVRELRARAAKAKIPIITVAIGDNRPPINIHITDLQTPEQARPDDKFPVRIAVDGQGLPNQDSNVTLEITSPSGTKFTEKRDFKFDAGSGGPPHAQIEFEMEPAKYGIPNDAKKMELEEGKWVFVAKVPRDKREAYPKDEHVSKEETVLVIKKPLRVLLFADAATRDFQFCRSLFVREVDQRRAQLSICLQTQRPGLVQDVPADRLLKHFPTRLGGEAGEKAEERYYNLSEYDLIVAFDPDWTQLTPEQANLLEQWVRLHAGGLVLIAGPIHTTKLARPGPIRDQLRQLLDLFPVFLKDSTLLELTAREKARSQAYRLFFPGATPDLEFLKLEDEGKELLSGWEEFFTGKPKAEAIEPVVERGFFSYYPILRVKPSGVVVAAFADPSANLDDGKPQPYLVTMPYGGGKVIYLSSGETYRLRTYKEAYHERFWTKLGRYAGSGTLSRLSKHGVLVMSREFNAGQMVRLEAQLFGRDMQPLGQNATPQLELKLPAGVSMPTRYTLRPKPSASSEWNGWFQGTFRATQPGDYRLELQIPETGETLQGKFTVRETDPEMDNTQPDFNFLYQLASPVSEVEGRLEDAKQRKLEETLKSTAARLVGLQEDSGSEAAKSREGVRLFFDLDSADQIPTFLGQDSRTQRNKGRMEDQWDRGLIVKKDELQYVVRTARLGLIMLGMFLLGCVIFAWLLEKPMRKIILAAAIVFLVQLPIWVLTQLPTEWLLPSGLTAAGNLVPVAGPEDERVLILSYVLLTVVALLSLEWMTRKLLKLA